jgi:serine/threonine-protein kinase
MRERFDLSPAQWTTLRGLLDEALDRPAAARAAWLAALPREHEALRPRLQALLSHVDAPTAGRLLETLPKIETAQFAPLPAPDGGLPTDAVGPYRLIRELGSGGMASVWLAERTDMLHGRRVALKLPHGAWRRAGLAERLAREREILATLEHPHIARLYDAGVADDGQPYLAIEYVEGERLDDWCNRRALDVDARLRLFLQVARAVAYAHSRLVVHRDLKPSNILVTGAGEVKLLDFGIAKLLDADHPAAETALTQQSGRAMTPEYAAPEQVSGQPVGTPADVYALGVVLYELLAGERPYVLRRASRAALEEAIASAEIQPPSARAPAARRRALRGDLDTIVIKALKREPQQRYATVAALAEDIERHLADQPVLAQPDGTLYRVGKFMRRHRWPVAVATLVLCALVGGGGAAVWQAQLARGEAARAQRALHIATANKTLADFVSTDLAAQRSVTDVTQQLDRAAAMVRRQYAGDTLAQAHLLADLSGRYRGIGQFDQFRTLAAEAEAAASAAGERALEAQLACRRARDLAQGGDLAGAQRVVGAAIARLEAPGDAPLLPRVECLADASAIARTGGDAAEAIRTAERIRELEVAAGEDRTPGHADTLLILARAYALAGRFAQALAATERGLALHRTLGTFETVQANNLRGLHAQVLRDGGQPLRALAEQDDLLADHLARGGERRTVSSLLYERGLTLLALGRASQAAAELTETLQAALQRGDRSQARATAAALTTAQAAAAQPRAARASLAEAMGLFAQPLEQRTFSARFPLFAQAELALAEGSIDEAARAIDQAGAIVEGRPGRPQDAAARLLHGLRARLALAQGRAAEALVPAGQALAISRAQAIRPEASVFVAEDLVLRAQALHASGDVSAAREAAGQAQRHLIAAGSPELIARAQQRLAAAVP